MCCSTGRCTSSPAIAVSGSCSKGFFGLSPCSVLWGVTRTGRTRAWLAGARRSIVMASAWRGAARIPRHGKSEWLGSRNPATTASGGHPCGVSQGRHLLAPYSHVYHRRRPDRKPPPCCKRLYPPRALPAEAEGHRAMEGRAGKIHVSLTAEEAALHWRSSNSRRPGFSTQEPGFKIGLLAPRDCCGDARAARQGARQAAIAPRRQGNHLGKNFAS